MIKTERRISSIEKIIEPEKEKCIRFLDIIRDYNPIHREGNIVPGTYLYSQLSKLIYSERGEKYARQELKFRIRAIYGDKLLLQMLPDEKWKTAETKILRNDKIITEGRAYFRNEEKSIQSDGMKIAEINNSKKIYKNFLEIISSPDNERMRKAFLSSMLSGEVAKEIFLEKEIKLVVHSQRFNFLTDYIPENLYIYKEKEKERPSRGVKTMGLFLMDTSNNNILLNCYCGLLKEAG